MANWLRDASDENFNTLLSFYNSNENKQDSEDLNNSVTRVVCT